MTKYSPTANTIIKEFPYPSDDEKAGQVRDVRTGEALEIVDIEPGLFSGHYEVELDGAEKWGHIAYLYHEHWPLPDSDRLNPDRLSISQAGVDLIKEFEGCRLEAYYCPANVLTVGYGSTHNVRPGMCLTKLEAEELLKSDLKQYEAAVKRVVTVPLSQGEYDALVSFAFNVGPRALKTSTLLRMLNSGYPKGEVADQFLRWDKAGGRSLPGLTRRRKAERELFLS